VASKTASIGSKSFGIRIDNTTSYPECFYDRVEDEHLTWFQAWERQTARKFEAECEAERNGKENSIPYYPDSTDSEVKAGSGGTARYRYDELNDVIWDTTAGEGGSLKASPERWKSVTKEEASIYGQSGKHWKRRSALPARE